MERLTALMENASGMTSPFERKVSTVIVCRPVSKKETGNRKGPPFMLTGPDAYG